MDNGDKKDADDSNFRKSLTAPISAPQTRKEQRIYGNYNLLASIGQGGMGEVFLAQRLDAGPNTPMVALKVLSPKASKNHSAVAMFIDEASIMSQIEHPNVLKVFDIGKELGCYFLVMEYLQGRSLAAVILETQNKGGRLSFTEAAAIGAGTARGLNGAHTALATDGTALNVIHRDVSPQNIFLSYKGQSKLIDFGIARASERLTVTSTGLFKGKAAYMSPEQSNLEEIDARTDIFALGICLWEMVANKRLFSRPTQMESIEAVHTDKIPPPSKVIGQPDAELDSIILKALRRNKETRTASAKDVETALTGYLRTKTFLSEETIIQSLMHRQFKKLSEEENHLLQALESSEKTDPHRLRCISGFSPNPNNNRVITFARHVEDLDSSEKKPEQPLTPQPATRHSESIQQSVQALSVDLAPLTERQIQERRVTSGIIEVLEPSNAKLHHGNRGHTQLLRWLFIAIVLLSIAFGWLASQEDKSTIDAHSIPPTSAK